MSDRLEEFRRQRALLQEHLAWIDREIAALDGAASGSNPAAAPRPVVPLASIAPIVRAVTPASAPAPEFPEYEPNAATLQDDTKRGCLVYAAMGLILFFALLAGIYFIGYRDHPLFRAEKPAASTPQK